MNKTILSVFAFFLLIIFGFSPITSLVAIPAADKIFIRWTSEREDHVQRYELLRRSGNGPFVMFSTIPPRGNGFNYEVVDMDVAQQLFIASRGEEDIPQINLTQRRITYLLRAVSTTGPNDEREVSVSFQTSSIRRTWGSIKALFR